MICMANALRRLWTLLQCSQECTCSKYITYVDKCIPDHLRKCCPNNKIQYFSTMHFGSYFCLWELSTCDQLIPRCIMALYEMKGWGLGSQVDTKATKWNPLWCIFCIRSTPIHTGQLQLNRQKKVALALWRSRWKTLQKNLFMLRLKLSYKRLATACLAT